MAIALFPDSLLPSIILRPRSNLYVLSEMGPNAAICSSFIYICLFLYYNLNEVGSNYRLSRKSGARGLRAIMEEILSDNIVAIVRYKNRDAYDDCRKVSTAPMEWLYQMPDDEAELAAMLEKLKKPAAFFEKVSGKYVGVFEVYRWSGSEVIERK